MEYLIPIWWPYVSKIVQKLRGPRFSHCSCHCKDFHWFSRIFQIIFIGFTSGPLGRPFHYSMFSASRRCVTHFAVWWAVSCMKIVFCFGDAHMDGITCCWRKILIKHLHSLHFFCWRNHLSTWHFFLQNLLTSSRSPSGPDKWTCSHH